jgi:hypothetical protein
MSDESFVDDKAKTQRALDPGERLESSLRSEARRKVLKTITAAISVAFWIMLAVFVVALYLAMPMDVPQ